MADTVPRDNNQPGTQGGAWLVVCRECEWQRAGAYLRGEGTEPAALDIAHTIGTAHELRYNVRKEADR
jgi:hypothetical protein